MTRSSLVVLVILGWGCASQPASEPAPASAPAAPAPATPTLAADGGPSAAAVPPEPEPEPPPAPIGCWERTFGAPPNEAGMGPSLSAPVAGCDGCETLRAGPNANGLHGEVLTRLLAIQRARPAPEVDEPVLWVNSGRREGNPSKSMHNQGLAIDVVVCGLDSPQTAALLREAGFSCVIEYYDPDGKPCHMAHADMRGTKAATAAYAPDGRKAGTCPERATSRGEDCQGSSKGDWYYRPSSAG